VLDLELVRFLEVFFIDFDSILVSLFPLLLKRRNNIFKLAAI